MDFRVIASGSGGNAYLVTEDGAPPMLVEAGIRYPVIQQGLSHRVTQLAGCLVSHQHGDHACAAGKVMRAGVDVYTSPECAEAMGLAGHRIHTVAPKARFMVGPWSVMAWPAVHDVTCYGFLIQAPSGDRLVYATDTAYIPYRFPALTHIAIGANYSEAVLRANLDAGAIPPAHYRRVLRSHMSMERVLEFLRANDLGRLRELHLLHLSDMNSDEAAFLRDARRITGVPVYVAAALPSNEETTAC